MCKKLYFLVSFVLLVGLVGSASAMVDIEWDNGDPCDNLWSSPLNWSNNRVPWVIDAATEDGVCTHIESGFALASSPLVDASVIKADPCTGSFSLGVYVGAWGSGDANLTMTGGYINADWEFACGAFHVDANGTFYMSGGLIETGYLAMGCCGTGNLYMTGGVIDTNGGPFAMPGDIADWLPKCTGTGTGHVNLDGGTIIAGSIFMQEPSTMDVNGGTLTILGDARGIIAQYAGLGWITGRGSSDPRNVGVVYDDVNDLTIVTYDPTPDLTVPWQPSPGMGSTGVYWKPTLSWQPGCYAETHDVYFGTSESEVSDANTASDPNIYRGNQSGTTYPIGSFLDFGQTYYWRIDEVNDPCVWPGPVWYFTVGDYVVVDDFDSYADTTALGAVWTEKEGAELKLEKTPALVRDGNSMMFTYDNDFTGGKGYLGSEAEASAAALEIGTDWTASGAKALLVYFLGDPANGQEVHEDYHILNDQMYVAVEDTGPNVGIVKYDTEHGYDMNAVKEASWHEWNISLQDPCLVAVDMNNVAKVYIGFGGQKTGQSGPGAGTKSGKRDTVWFDDIRVHPTRCIDEFAPAGDITGDCLVDYADVNALAGDWLLSDYNIAATAPPNGPVGWWKLDEGEGTNAVDSAGDNNGTHGGSHTLTWVGDCGDPCHSPCLDFDGVGYVDIPSEAFANVNDEITVTLWQYGTMTPAEVAHVMFQAHDACDPYDLTVKGELWYPSATGCEVYFDAGYGGEDSADSVTGLAGLNDYQGQWNHYAFTKKVSTGEMKIYLNGVLFADQGEENLNSPVTGTEITLFKLGSDADGGRRYTGRLNDVRLYNDALTYGEVRYVAGLMDDLYVPLPNPEVDLYLDGKANFKDYSVLANTWLVETFWP